MCTSKQAGYYPATHNVIFGQSAKKRYVAEHPIQMPAEDPSTSELSGDEFASSLDFLLRNPPGQPAPEFSEPHFSTSINVPVMTSTATYNPNPQPRAGIGRDPNFEPRQQWHAALKPSLTLSSGPDFGSISHIPIVPEPDSWVDGATNSQGSWMGLAGPDLHIAEGNWENNGAGYAENVGENPAAGTSRGIKRVREEYLY
jgi:hypothetical protein